MPFKIFFPIQFDCEATVSLGTICFQPFVEYLLMETE